MRVIATNDTPYELLLYGRARDLWRPCIDQLSRHCSLIFADKLVAHRCALYAIAPFFDALYAE
jgi:predicted ATPase